MITSIDSLPQFEKDSCNDDGRRHQILAPRASLDFTSVSLTAHQQGQQLLIPPRVAAAVLPQSRHFTAAALISAPLATVSPAREQRTSLHQRFSQLLLYTGDSTTPQHREPPAAVQHNCRVLSIHQHFIASLVPAEHSTSSASLGSTSSSPATVQ
ncbi:hypothetical protein NC651_038200 [Populus alba x Populus x berolinensis]|nr:hypothetical protein NC651_038200 [Populus alba x Populus x berolinensis]